MNVKCKLYLCTSIGLAGLAVVGGSSLLGMRFIGGQIRQLTEKSTPAQLKTIDLERVLQEHTSNLLRIQAATSDADFAKVRQDAGKSLSDVIRISGELDALKGDSAKDGSAKGKAAALSEATTQIAQTASEKISATAASAESLRSMNTQLQAMSKQLAALDESIRTAQTRATGNLTSANESASRIVILQGNIQSLKNHLRDMKMVLVELTAVEGKNDVLVARNNFNSAYRFLIGNEIIKSVQPGAGKMLADSLPDIQKAVLDKEGLVGTKLALIATPDGEGSKKFQASVKQVIRKVTNLLVYMEAQIETTTADVTKENQKFTDALKGSNVTGTILMLNSEITKLGYAIESGMGLLFGVRTSRQLDQIKADLVQKFGSADKLARKESALLSAAHYTSEIGHLNSVISSLAQVHSTLFSKGGVVEKLQGTLLVEEKANALSLKIREMVEKQREEGMKGVTLAQSEQEKAVLAVNKIVWSSFVLTAVLGAICLFLGTALANVLVRSITRQIGSLTALAKRFGEGEFTTRMDDSSKDEFGELAMHFNQTAERLRALTGQIADAISNLSSGSQELAAEAEEMNASATEVSAMTMSNADNAAQTNGLMSDTLKVIEQSNGFIADLTAAMGEIARTSEEAKRIIKTINAIALNTNLLALNAAVEAAHAGAVGEGFAVVAEEVKKLAVRASQAAQNTEGLIHEISQKVRRGSDLVLSTNDAFQRVVSISGTVGKLVSGIASASSEQATGINEISRGVSEITRVSMSNSKSTQQLASAISIFKTG